MMSSAERRRTRLSIEIEPELRREIESAAAENALSLHDYVVAVLRRALDEEQDNALAVNRAWAQLSARSFARDWNSDEDRVYDHLS